MSSKGFGIVQVLVGLTVLGAAGFALTALLSGQRGSLGQIAKFREMKSPALISNMLSSPQTCVKTFEGQRVNRMSNGQFEATLPAKIGDIEVAPGKSWMNMGEIYKVSLKSRSQLSGAAPGSDRYDASLVILGQDSGGQVAEWLSLPLVVDLSSDGFITFCQSKMESLTVPEAQCRNRGAQARALVGLLPDGTADCEDLAADVPTVACSQGQVLTGINNGQPLCVAAPAGTGQLIASVSREYFCTWERGEPRYSGNGYITHKEFVDGSSEYNTRFDGVVTNHFIEATVPPEASHMIMDLSFQTERLELPTSTIVTSFESFYWVGIVDLNRLASFLDLRVGKSDSEPRNFSPQSRLGESGILFRGGISSDGKQMRARPNTTQTQGGGGGEYGWYGEEAPIPSSSNSWSRRYSHHLRAADEKVAFQAWAKCFGSPARSPAIPSRVSLQLHFCSGTSSNPSHPCYADPASGQ
jgi:hypothetical protein